MPQPHIGQVHVDAILTSLSVAYMQRQENFIADRVFPVIPVDKKSDSYFVYTKNDWFRDEAQRRAPATPSAGGGYGLTTDTYSCDVFSFHKDVDDYTMANSDAPLQPMRDASNYVASRMLLRREIQFVSDYLSASVWGKDLTGVASGETLGTSVRQWSDYANSDPIEDVEYIKEYMLGITGFEVNTIVFGYAAWRKLKNHPDVVDRYKFTSSDNITTEMLARFFEVDRILVSKAIKATNNEGAAGAYSFVTGKSATFLHVAPEPGLLIPSAGYQFAWKGVSDGMGQTIGTRQFRMEELRATRVESDMAFDNKKVAADLGVHVASIVA